MGKNRDIVIKERTITPRSHSRHSHHSHHRSSSSKGGRSYKVIPVDTSSCSSSYSSWSSDSGYESDQRRKDYEYEREMALLRRERHKARKQRKADRRASKKETEEEEETNVLQRINRVGLKEGLFGAASGTAGLLFFAKNLANILRNGDGSINKKGPVLMGGGGLLGIHARHGHNKAKPELAMVKRKKTKKSRSSRRVSDSE